MKYTYLLFIILILISCDTRKNQSPDDGMAVADASSNITQEMVSEMNWFFQPESFEIVDSCLLITVSKGTDFFNNPEDSSITASAPFLYKELEGDFVAKTLVQPDFSSQWNAACLMLHIDSLHWIKLAFENSDATGPGIVTVVTNGTSDDANGVILNEAQQVWLAIARKNNIYSMYWSTDGNDYKMARLTAMPEVETVKIGVEAQSPVGEKATHRVCIFEVEERTVQDLRNLK